MILYQLCNNYDNFKVVIVINNNVKMKIFLIFIYPIIDTVNVSVFIVYIHYQRKCWISLALIALPLGGFSLNRHLFGPFLSGVVWTSSSILAHTNKLSKSI